MLPPVTASHLTGLRDRREQDRQSPPEGGRSVLRTPCRPRPARSRRRPGTGTGLLDRTPGLRCPPTSCPLSGLLGGCSGRSLAAGLPTLGQRAGGGRRGREPSSRVDSAHTHTHTQRERTEDTGRRHSGISFYRRFHVAGVFREGFRKVTYKPGLAQHAHLRCSPSGRDVTGTQRPANKQTRTPQASYCSRLPRAPPPAAPGIPGIGHQAGEASSSRGRATVAPSAARLSPTRAWGLSTAGRAASSVSPDLQKA